MKSLSMVIFIAAGLALTGCVQSGGGTEISSTNTNNEDFSVVTDPGDDSSGSTDGGAGSGPVGGGDSGPVTPPSTAPSDGFSINKGALLTASTNLSLEFFPPFSAGYTKVSANDTCGEGTWVRYVATDSHLSTKVNQSVPLSVQFRDLDGRMSACYVNRIYIDQKGPDIVFAKYPSAPVEEGTDVEVIFTVSDEGAGVSEVSCQFGIVTKVCSAGQNKATFPKMAAGDYTFTVSAKDKLGFSSQKAITFKVSSLYKQMVQNVKVTENNKVDILFVVDNSGSMAYEQTSMASRVRNFLDVVKGLDWQIAVTTTDPDNINLGDGRLVPLYGKTGSYVLNSSMSDSDARTTLGMTLQRPETGSGYEQGILTTYRAIERSLASSNSSMKFIRNESQLAVVLISDEDESANGAKNDPANLVKYVQDTFQGQKAMSFHSIIARPGDTACLGGEGYSAGFRYEQMSKLTGGVIGDVCASDYAAQVQGIAEGVRKTLKTISLSCAPVIDALHSVQVLKDGQVYNGTRTLTGQNLVFDDLLPGGNYEVYYSCVK